MNELRPAEQLEGKILDAGWRVLNQIPRPAHATGGCFSQCYMAESEDSSRAFVKALDYSRAFETPDPARALEAMTVAFNFERDLLAKCKDRHMDRVVRILGHGTIRIEGAPAGGVVQYLIFELADEDIRSHLSLSEKVDVAWKLRCLHHIATGLQQLHTAGIAHQDVKPSNVVLFEKKVSKLADLGRAAYAGREGPHDELDIAGELSYAPPELLYGYQHPDWEYRRLGCDAYLFGSMVVFLFTGLSATSMLAAKLNECHMWRVWAGTFEEVLPYLRNAFGLVLGSFSAEIRETTLAAELRIIVSQLCEPDPRLRGIPRDIRGVSSPFAMDRYIAKFNLLAVRAEMGLSKGY